MAKFSDFIRNPGTAGPAIVQGVYALGFALRSEIPAMFAKYVRVDEAQSFTAPEKAQGRDNLGLASMATQDAANVGITGGVISGISDLAIADGGTGASTPTAARANLGLGNVDNTSDADKPVSTAQQTALNSKASLASPAFTGNPTAPTPSVGDNDTSIATTAFVRAEFPNLLNATGAAPVFAARAWVNFNGIGVVTIRASGNVSSVTNNGVGDYTINFTTAMPDADYCAVGGCSQDNTVPGGYVESVQFPLSYARTAGACQIATNTMTPSTSAQTDKEFVFLAVFR